MKIKKKEIINNNKILKAGFDEKAIERLRINKNFKKRHFTNKNKTRPYMNVSDVRKKNRYFEPEVKEDAYIDIISKTKPKIENLSETEINNLIKNEEERLKKNIIETLDESSKIQIKEEKRKNKKKKEIKKEEPKKEEVKKEEHKKEEVKKEEPKKEEPKYEEPKELKEINQKIEQYDELIKDTEKKIYDVKHQAFDNLNAYLEFLKKGNTTAESREEYRNKDYEYIDKIYELGHEKYKYSDKKLDEEIKKDDYVEIDFDAPYNEEEEKEFYNNIDKYETKEERINELDKRFKNATEELLLDLDIEKLRQQAKEFEEQLKKEEDRKYDLLKEFNELKINCKFEEIRKRPEFNQFIDDDFIKFEKKMIKKKKKMDELDKRIAKYHEELKKFDDWTGYDLYIDWDEYDKEHNNGEYHVDENKNDLAEQIKKKYNKFKKKYKLTKFEKENSINWNEYYKFYKEIYDPKYKDIKKLNKIEQINLIRDRYEKINNFRNIAKKNINKIQNKLDYIDKVINFELRASDPIVARQFKHFFADKPILMKQLDKIKKDLNKFIKQKKVMHFKKIK